MLPLLLLWPFEELIFSFLFYSFGQPRRQVSLNSSSSPFFTGVKCKVFLLCIVWLIIEFKKKKKQRSCCWIEAKEVNQIVARFIVSLISKSSQLVHLFINFNNIKIPYTKLEFNKFTDSFFFTKLLPRFACFAFFAASAKNNRSSS